MPVKRKLTQSQISSSSKKAKPDPEGQRKLSSFFGKPKDPAKPIVVQDSDDDNVEDDHGSSTKLPLIKNSGIQPDTIQEQISEPIASTSGSKRKYTKKLKTGADIVYSTETL